jgi:hypothetical protein
MIRPPYHAPVLTFGLALMALLNGCSSNDSVSKLRYAHAPAAILAGTPLGHLEIMKAGIPHTLGERLRVCLQSSGDRATDSSRLFETRLAHAAWLASAGYTASDYNRLTFEIQAQCNTADTAFMTIVIFGDKSREKSGDDFDKRFSPARMSCSSSAEGISCQSDGGITLGTGGPAALRSFYRSDAPQIWTKVERTSPGTVMLSPYVSWKPMTDQLQAAASSPNERAILQMYRSLQAQSAPRFEDLKSLADGLSAATIKGHEDQEFKRIMQQFAQNGGGSGQTISGYEYRPVLGSFNTLLHEVGHTFGMMHADNPEADVVTGPSATTSCDASGRCTTKESTMAYGEAFNYLTADDVAGIQAAARAVQGDIASRR